VPELPLLEPIGLKNPSLIVIMDPVTLQDHIIVTWSAHPEMTSAWRVDIDIFREGLRIAGRVNVPATNETADLSVPSGGSNRWHNAVLHLRDPNGAVIATYTTPSTVTIE